MPCIYFVFVERLTTIMLSVVLCGYETWSRALGDKCRLRVFGNRVLMYIFWTERVESEREKLHNEKLRYVYS